MASQNDIINTEELSSKNSLLNLHQRSKISKKRGYSKQINVVMKKLRHQKEAALAPKCGHVIGSKLVKKRIALSKVPEIIYPWEVKEDVYWEHEEDRDQEYLEQLMQMQEQEQEQEQDDEKPGPWDLNLQPYLDDMYYDLCGPWYESLDNFDSCDGPLDSFPDDWSNFPYDSDPDSDPDSYPDDWCSYPYDRYVDWMPSNSLFYW
jgi:hypothetical protein